MNNVIKNKVRLHHGMEGAEITAFAFLAFGVVHGVGALAAAHTSGVGHRAGGRAGSSQAGDPNRYGSIPGGSPAVILRNPRTCKNEGYTSNGPSSSALMCVLIPDSGTWFRRGILESGDWESDSISGGNPDNLPPKENERIWDPHSHLGPEMCLGIQWNVCFLKWRVGIPVSVGRQ